MMTKKTIKVMVQFNDEVKGKLKQTKKALANISSLKGVSSIASASIHAAHMSKLVNKMLDENIKWQARIVNWRIRNQDAEIYPDTLKAYKTFGNLLICFSDLTPVRAMEVNTPIGKQWLTIKEAIEYLSENHNLPDIDPYDALELGKTTKFSADQWWQGCTNKRYWEKS